MINSEKNPGACRPAARTWAWRRRKASKAAFSVTGDGGSRRHARRSEWPATGSFLAAAIVPRAREEAPVADTVADNGEKLIDGKRMAETIRAEIAAEVPKVSLGPVAGSVHPCRTPQFSP